MKNIFFILFFFGVNLCFAQELILCQKIKEQFDFFALDYHDFIAQKAIDGNLIVSTSINKYLSEPREKTPVLIKIDTSGNLILKQRLAVNLNVKAFVSTSDSGFLMVGSRYRANKKYRDAGKNLLNGLIARFDKNANLLWEKEVEGLQSCEFKAIEATKDGNFILIAELFPLKKIKIWNWDYNTDIGIYKINTEGEIISQDFYGGDSWDRFKKMQKLNDGSFEVLLFLGTNERRMNFKQWIIKFSPNGIFQHQRVEELEDGKDISSFYTLSAEHKIEIGTIPNGRYPYRDTCRLQGIIQIQNQANKVEKRFCDETFRSIDQQQGSIYLGGYSSQFNERLYSSKHTGFIKKLDENGNLLWDKKIIDPEVGNSKVKKIINISPNIFWIVTIAGEYLTDPSIYIYKLRDY